MAFEDADERLRRAFHFAALDLEHNRAGALSPTQEKRLRRARWAAGAALALALAAGLGWLFRSVRQTMPEALTPAWMLAIAAATAAALGAALRGYLTALGTRRIDVAEGSAARLSEGWVRIGPTLLPLAPGLACAFEEGAPYRVFYLKGPRALVLSAEPLAAAPAARR